MERDEAYNARDLAYHMTQEDYDDMMFDRSFNEGLDMDDDRDDFDSEADWDDGEFDRFQDDFDDDDYVDDEIYCDWHDDHPEFDE